MSNKNYRTLKGLYKALVPIVTGMVGGYEIEENEDDIAIFVKNYNDEPISGYGIEQLLPVLKRANWMVRYNSFENRVELLVWICDDLI